MMLMHDYAYQVDKAARPRLQEPSIGKPLVLTFLIVLGTVLVANLFS